MNDYELKMEQQANLEYLNSILDSYQSSERKSKKILAIIVVIGGIAIYFMFSNLLGSTLGYILTLVVLGIGVYCLNTSGILSKFCSVPDGKLAYQACVTMEILIAIKHKTYRQYGSHVITTSLGNHIELYNRFIQLYPEYASKTLKKLAKKEVKLDDI